jgi:uncharacterized membrane protein YbhN (UPF0104 family)
MPDASPARPVKFWRRPLFRVAFSVIIVALLFTILPADELLAAVRRLPPWAWLLAIPSYLALHVIGIVKWRLLTNAAGAGLGFTDAARAYYSGLFGNMFLPSIVGGDVVRAGVAFGVVRSKSGLVLGSLVDRLQDIVGLGLVAGIGALMSPRALSPESRMVFWMLAGLVGVGALGALMAWWLMPSLRLPYKIRRKLVPVRRAVRATAAKPSRLFAALVLGMLLQSGLIVLNWALGLGIGIDIPLYVWFFVWPLAKISGLLPVTQGGIGVREAAQAALFAPFGVSAVMAVATGLVFEVVIITGGLLGGLIAWALGRRARSGNGAAHLSPGTA